MPARNQPVTAGLPPWASWPRALPSLLRDFGILLAGLSLFYSFLLVTRYWMAPLHEHPEIHLTLAALPKYAAFSVMRLAAAYVLSLIFTLIYGYVAAYNAKAER